MSSRSFVSNACGPVGARLTGTANTTVFAAVGYVQVIGIRLANTTATVNWFSSWAK